MGRQNTRALYDPCWPGPQVVEPPPTTLQELHPVQAGTAGRIRTSRPTQRELSSAAVRPRRANAPKSKQGSTSLPNCPLPPHRTRNPRSQARACELRWLLLCASGESLRTWALLIRTVKGSERAKATTMVPHAPGSANLPVTYQRKSTRTKRQTKKAGHNQWLSHCTSSVSA